MAKTSHVWCIKCCPSCGGDLYADMNDTREFKCLQCGRLSFKRTEAEQKALREEVGIGRKVRLP